MYSSPEPAEKRNVEDRRKRKIPPVKYLLFGGRRTRIRRNKDKQELVLVDRYNPKLLIMAVSILILSIGDGLFTLYLMDHGAKEINPIMDYFIEVSPWAFLFVKFTLTSCALICILIINHLHFKPLNIRIRILFPVFVVALLFVIFWQVYLSLSLLS